MSAAPDADVTIVGYGPTGKTLAILLAQRGHIVVVLERWPQAYPLPRAVHFDHEVGRILQSCGVGAELRATSEAAEVYEWQSASRVPLLRFGRIGAGLSGWPESSMFHQPTLEALLDRRVAVLPGIEVRRGVEVAGVDSSEAAVMIRGTDQTGHTVEVVGRYVVGCDGANSTVRDLIAMPVHDLGFFYDWLIVDVILNDSREFTPLNLQVCDPARPTTAVSGGPGRRRWEFMRLPQESRADLDSEEMAWSLLKAWDVTPANAHIERHAVYTFAASYADRWRDGRVLLAGDAAHQMPPFAGQGMCSGLRDAASLAVKLDLVLRGAPETLLDTYADERLPSVRAAIDFSIALGQVICVLDVDAARERDEAMSAIVGAGLTEVPETPPISGGLCHATAPLAGHLVPQGVVEIAGKRGLFDDVLGAGWRLLTTAAADGVLDADLLQWFASLGGAVVRLVAGVDAELTYTKWFSTHEVSWALQRPDFVLYGAATSSDAATELLRDLRGRLTLMPGSAGEPS